MGKVKVTINIPPQPKGRPRLSNGHAYTPQKTRDYEEAVKLIARTQIKRPLSGEIRASVNFYVQTPKSWSKAKFQLAERGQIRPAVKPDIDNLAKAILDALNSGIGYNDDKQIVELHLQKFYSGRPRTEIELEEI